LAKNNRAEAIKMTPRAKISAGEADGPDTMVAILSRWRDQHEKVRCAWILREERPVNEISRLTNWRIFHAAGRALAVTRSLQWRLKVVSINI
jgi:hypothetical protein